MFTSLFLCARLHNNPTEPGATSTLSNPVQYAEETLGVHGVWQECQDRLAAHDQAKALYLKALSGLRDTKAELADRERSIVSDERGNHPDMKPMAFKDHIKSVLDGDLYIKGYRKDLAGFESLRDEAEADMRHHELGVRALTARMHELAGLLDFYGAAKATKTGTSG